MSNPKIAVVIPTYTNSKGLHLCLASLVEKTDLENLAIIVVANGAPEESRHVQTQYPNTKLIWLREACGYTKATNIGIQDAMRAGAEYIVLMNDDFLCTDHHPKNLWRDMLLAPFLEEPKMGITGPVRNFCHAAQRSFLIFFCVMVRTAMLEEIGILDEIFSPGSGEDTDLSCRAEDNGWIVRQVPSEVPTQLVDAAGCKDLPEWKRLKMHTSTFPGFHAGNVTFSLIPEIYEPAMQKNHAILAERYGQKVVNSERAKTVEGWFAEDEIEWLGGQVKALPKGAVVVEVGSWKGRSSRAIADNLPEGARLYCVDTFNGSSGEPDAHATAKSREGDDTFMSFFHALHDHIDEGRVVPVRMSSVNAAETLNNLRPDLIFLDGDHSEEGIKTDIVAWLPLLKQGGLLCGHDYYRENEGPHWVFVRQTVEARFPNVEKSATSIWHVRPNLYPQFHEPEYAAVVENEHRAMIDKWFEAVPINAAILDLGCGDGVAVKMLRDLGFVNVLGVDIKGGEGVTQSDMHALPLADNSFDIIYSVHSLEHATDPLKVLSECKRVLKSDGQLFLILPYPDYLYDEHRATVHCGSIPLGLHVVDNGEMLCKLLEENGFSVTSVEGGSLRNESEIYLQLKSKEVETERPYIYDCFLFHNELDVLEIRLATLCDTVDRFVLVEATSTHAGEPKPLYFDENTERFKQYLNKIDHIIIDFPEFEGNVYEKAWARERFQRDMCMRALEKCKDTDIIIIGDADEIASPEVVKNYKVEDGLVRLKQRMFYYFLNCENKEGWDWQKIAPYKLVKELTPCGIRYPPAGDVPLIEGGGWHFSFAGSTDHIIQKLKDYSHQEFNREDIIARVPALVAKGEDIFGRDLKYEFVDIDEDYPQWVRDRYVLLMSQGLVKPIDDFAQDVLERYERISTEIEQSGVSNVIEFKRPLTVTAEVSTKDRYHCLPLTLSAIINQTRVPERLVVYDDGENRISAEDLSERSPFKGLFTLAASRGIEWEIQHTPRQGQVSNHQHCLETAQTSLIWRVDDDEIPEATCLEVLLAEMKEDVGAVGGLVHGPEKPSPLPQGVDGSLNDIAKGLNLSWFDWNSGPRECEHLYSTFLYRVAQGREVGGYPMGLSPAGHREESWFSNKLHRAGHKVICTPHARTIHFRESTGGIRSYTDNSMWEHDEGLWQQYLKLMNVVLPDTKLVVCDFGLGDHLILKGIWAELKRKFPERKWTLALCFPEVFQGEDATIISIADAKMLLGSRYDEHSVYRYAWDNNFERPMPEVMLEFFSK